jgi:hypothetical protein
MNENQQNIPHGYVCMGEFDYPFKKEKPITEEEVGLELEKNYRFYCQVNSLEMNEFVEMKDLLKNSTPILKQFVGDDIEKAFYYMLLSLEDSFIRSEDGMMVRGSDNYYYKANEREIEDTEDEESDESTKSF